MTRAVIAFVVSLALAGTALAQPTMSEPPPRVEPGSETPPPAADRRPFYVAGGALVLGALFLWNRRRRAEIERRIERETRLQRHQVRAARAAAVEASPPSSDAPDPPPDVPDDPDAADLRAAARSSEQEPT